MKRLTLLTILLVAVGLASGFSLELKPGFTLSASGKLEWGINLDTLHTGFKNSETIDAYVWLFKDETTDTHQGEGDWYGVIKVKDIELFWYTNEAKYFAAGATPTSTAGWSYTDVGVSDLANEDPDVEAKIVGMGGKLAIGVYSDPDLGSNEDFVASMENDDKTDNDVDYKTVDDETSTEADLGEDWAGPGTYASYTISDALMVGLEVVSNNDWTVDDSDAYALALDVQYKIAPLTILAGVNYGFAPFATTAVGPTAGLVSVIGFGLKVSADTDMVDGWVGFDGGFGDEFEYEFGAGAIATLFEVTTAEVAVTYNTGLTVPSVADSDLDLKVILTEPAAKGLVDNLDVKVQLYLLDLLTTVSEYEVLVDAGYLMGKIYPHVSLDFGNDVNTGSTVKALNGEYFNLTVGVDWTAIPLTTLSVHYTSGDLWETDALMGTIVFSAKVAY
jgi:hypothetical protein